MIAVDGSSASMQAVAYVADLFGGRSDVTIRLLHVLPPIPPSLREFGGSEDPQEEVRLSGELRHSQHRWTEDATRAAKPAIDRAVMRLLEHGFTDRQVIEDVCQPVQDRDDVVQVILEAAKERNCGTIVVGRRTLPWWQELFARHVSEELVRKAEHCAVWVVETSDDGMAATGRLKEQEAQ